MYAKVCVCVCEFLECMDIYIHKHILTFIVQKRHLQLRIKTLKKLRIETLATQN